MLQRIHNNRKIWQHNFMQLSLFQQYYQRKLLQVNYELAIEPKDEGNWLYLTQYLEHIQLFQ